MIFFRNFSSTFCCKDYIPTMPWQKDCEKRACGHMPACHLITQNEILYNSIEIWISTISAMYMKVSTKLYKGFSGILSCYTLYYHSSFLIHSNKYLVKVINEQPWTERYLYLFKSSKLRKWKWKQIPAAISIFVVNISANIFIIKWLLGLC